MKYFISIVSMAGMLSFSSFLVLTDIISSSMIYLLVGVLCISNMSSFSKSSKLWPFLLIILMGSFMVTNLMLFYVLFETSLIPILLMILFWGNQPERLSAGLYFLIYTGAFSLPFLVLVLFSLKSGVFTLMQFTSTSMTFNLLMLAPFLVKMPILGLHFWLPKAHVEASTSGSMVLAGILLKLGSYGVYRICALFYIQSLMKLSSFWLMTATLASVMTFMQSDMKKIVAYSSVTHMTFMMVGLCSMSKIVIVSVIMLSLAHGWASMAMFAGAGMFSVTINSRLGLLMGVESKFHWSVILLGVLLLSNASLPPFPSFFPELFMVSYLASSSKMVGVFILMSLLVCYYNTYLYLVLSHFKISEVKTATFSMTEFVKMMNFSLYSLVSLLLLSFI